MSCICSSSFLYLHFQPRNHQRLKTRKQQVWLFTSNPTTRRLELQRPSVVVPQMSLDGIATASFLLTSAPRGDIKVLLQSGAILVFMYLIANFVAPYFISKYFGFDKADEEDQKVKEKDPFGR